MSPRTQTNPFCTRFFHPGAIPFFFHPPMTLDSLVHRILEDSRRRSAIVGPHGSGKSTLLAHVIQHPALSAPGGSISHVFFQTGEAYRHRWRTCNRALNSIAGENRRLLVVDGWEQMDWILQWYTRKRAHARGIGILATSHTLPKEFTEIWRTCVDATIEQHVLKHMLQSSGSLASSTVTESLAWNRSRQRHGQNLRESLFDMYDWYRDQVDAHSATG